MDTGIGRNDTLQGILHDMSQRQLNNITLAKNVPPVGIFHTHWYYLDARIRGHHFTAAEFHDAAEELFGLVQSYTSFSVNPVFHVFASEFREVLPENEKSKMNAFQQQYVSFINSYTEFLSRLDDEFHGFPPFQKGIAKPAPL